MACCIAIAYLCNTPHLVVLCSFLGNWNPTPADCSVFIVPLLNWQFPAMPTTHHCQCCSTNGFCKKHQIKCEIHRKVFCYKADNNGYPKKCKLCDRSSAAHFTISGSIATGWCRQY